MRRETRKQPWQTFPFWFLILAGMAMTVAWKLDLFPAGSAEIADANSFEPDSNESAPDWASEPVSDEVVLEQSEPLLTPEEPRTFPANGETQTALHDPGTESPSTPLIPSSVAVPESSDGTLAQNTPAARRADSPFGRAHAEFEPATPLASRSSATRNNPWSGTEAESLAPVQSAIRQVSASESVEAPLTETPGTVEHASNQAVTPEPSLNQPSSSVAAPSLAALEADLAKIDQLIADGEDVEANFLLSNMYWKQPAVRTHIMERLRTVAYRIYFAPTPHYMTAHTVAPGDALQKIAKEYDISWEYLAKLNRTDAQKIRPGQKLKVIQGPFSAVVDLSDRELTVHSHGHFVARFDVGIGQDHPSPIGKFQVLDKQRDPTYYGDAGVVEHDDPSNPLGEHWLDLGEGICLHGTPDNVSLTAPQTQGSIRLKPRDVADLYDLLTTGAEVTVRR